ncbi:ROK family protein [Fredinandcohnia sp. 179-A 10B2 NHS]|uniref:ROK family protein n=1 Tax=Fredinandcohnia sp. 179-A 10B2 NHS TaxID=3235176 RepID=UPI00399EFD4D
MGDYTIGIDLGGTNLRVALVDKHGTILQELERSTEPEKGPEFVVSNMVEMIQSVKGDHPVDSIGIGSPGPLNPKTGVIIEPPNLTGWSNVHIVEMLQKAINIQVTLDNDANAAALAEATIGAGAGHESVFYITVSTGIGGGYIIENKVVQGAQGYAGEIGNMIVVPNGRKHSNLNPGALEALASGTAIAHIAEEKGIKGGTAEVFRLAEEGNSKAREIIDDALTYLAIGIANLAHAVNPDIFVLGGGVMKSEKQVLEPLREKVANLLYPGLRDSIKIVPAGLGSKAGVVGAALLPRQ